MIAVPAFLLKIVASQGDGLYSCPDITVAMYATRQKCPECTHKPGWKLRECTDRPLLEQTKSECNLQLILFSVAMMVVALLAFLMLNICRRKAESINSREKWTMYVLSWVAALFVMVVALRVSHNMPGYCSAGFDYYALWVLYGLLIAVPPTYAAIYKNQEGSFAM